MNKHKTPPSARRALQHANASADAHFNAKRMRKALGDRSNWSLKDILRTGIGPKRKNETL